MTCFNMSAFLVDLGMSIIAGVISGLLVYFATKRREKKYQVYSFWMKFLFDSFNHCEIFIPYDLLETIGEVGDKGSKWQESIYAILDEINPYGYEDKELTDSQERIAINIAIALKELEKWRVRNRL